LNGAGDARGLGGPCATAPPPVFKAHRLLVSLNSRLESNKEEAEEGKATLRFESTHDRPLLYRVQGVSGSRVSGLHTAEFEVF